MAIDFTDLRQVGEFNSHLASRGRLRRSVRNPMDKCTVISILPKLVDEVKWTIEPSKFRIEAGTFENPSVLVVGSASYWRELDIEQPLLEIPVSSVQLAESIVKDYCNGMLGCDMDTAMPGLFFVLGVVNASEIKLRYKDKLNEVKVKQNNWFMNLVTLADALWAVGNGNPRVTSEEMKMSAKSLNLNDKPWLKDFNLVQMVKCKACGSLKHPDFPVCAVCRAVDASHPNSKDLKFAQ